MMPILDYFYKPHLLLESHNLTQYIICNILLIGPNVILNVVLIIFYDTARADWGRKKYLMTLLTSCIQADEGLKNRNPEMIYTPLFNFLD